MTWTVTVDVAGLENAVARLDDLGGRINDPSPAFEAIREMFYKAEERLFDTRGGGRWQPDAPDTVRRKARHGQDLRTMRATGSLFRSLTRPGAPGGVWRPSVEGFEIGTSVFHARWAQYASDPAEQRRPVVVTSGMRAQWVDALREYIVEGDR